MKDKLFRFFVLPIVGTAMIVLRGGCQSLSVWKSHGRVAVTAPQEYSMGGLEMNATLCHFCGIPSNTLHRVGFANVACPVCVDAAKARIEVPGWND